jgi:cytochrome c peroxidase
LQDTDIGRGKQVPGVVVMKHAFKVPTLRNVAERAPYMHDGSLKNLFSVVRHYNDGFKKRPSKSADIFKLRLSDDEQSDLVEFMKTLSSNDTAVALPNLPAFDQTVAGSLSGVSPTAGPTGTDATTSQSCNTLMQHWLPCSR